MFKKEKKYTCIYRRTYRLRRGNGKKCFKKKKIFPVASRKSEEVGWEDDVEKKNQ